MKILVSTSKSSAKKYTPKQIKAMQEQIAAERSIAAANADEIANLKGVKSRYATLLRQSHKQSKAIITELYGILKEAGADTGGID